MTSSIPSKLSSHRLLVALMGAALTANIALAAQPVPDTQELARQFILGTPNVELLAESNRQARGFTPAPAAQVDSQQQVRQFILGLAQRGDPSHGA